MIIRTGQSLRITGADIEPVRYIVFRLNHRKEEFICRMRTHIEVLLAPHITSVHQNVRIIDSLVLFIARTAHDHQVS
ncbi:MAG TPA: hypothetical protein DEP53_11490, partial [Bacteroidetes bacterium]|nr:hypothetical protein [Bacteroidota bacterium]